MTWLEQVGAICVIDLSLPVFRSRKFGKFQFLAEYKGTVVCITHDRYFLENVAQWILELDRGEGIPFEGNYSAWLEAKNNRLEAEKKQQTAVAKAVAAELEWVRSNPKAKGNKSKARLNRYEELLAAAAPKELRNAGQIYIPPGPRLGDVVIDVDHIRKSFEYVFSIVCAILIVVASGAYTTVSLHPLIHPLLQRTTPHQRPQLRDSKSGYCRCYRAERCRKGKQRWCVLCYLHILLWITI